jgi:hypothetical protein
MNRYRITALEEVDVSVSDERPATILVRGVPRQISTRGSPRWRHMSKGEACEVLAVHSIRGDLFEESRVTPPGEGAAPVVIHEALKIEVLPPPDARSTGRVFQSDAASTR